MKSFDTINPQAEAFRIIAIDALDDLEDGDDFWMTVAELRNGRERGYCVALNAVSLGVSHQFRVFFAEERNSDRLFLWSWWVNNGDAPFAIDTTAGVQYGGRLSFEAFRFDLAREALLGLIRPAMAAMKDHAKHRQDRKKLDGADL